MTFFRIQVVMYLVGQGCNMKEVKVKSPTPLHMSLAQSRQGTC